MLNWLLRTGQGLVVYFLLPLFLWALPVWLSGRLLRRIAGWPLFFRRETRRARRKAAALTGIGNEKRWEQRWRLVRLMEITDLYHGLWSSDRRLRKLVRIDGQMPAGRAGGLVGVHSGPGTLMLRLTGMGGVKAGAVYRDADPSSRAHNPVFYWYQRCRQRYIEKTCVGGTVITPGSQLGVRRILQDPEVGVFLAFDLPSASGKAVEAELFGQPVRLERRGMQFLAHTHAPVTFHSVRLSDDDLVREVTLRDMPAAEGVDQYIRHILEFVEPAVNGEADQWHFWGVAEQLFPDLLDERGPRGQAESPQ